MIVDTDNLLRGSTLAKRWKVPKQRLDYWAKRGKLKLVRIDEYPFFFKDQEQPAREKTGPRKPKPIPQAVIRMLRAGITNKELFLKTGYNATNVRMRLAAEGIEVPAPRPRGRPQGSKDRRRRRKRK